MEHVKNNFQFGVVDNRFLSRSIGLLEPSVPVTVELTATVGDVVTTLREHRIGCVLVVNGDGTLAGIFTERDVLQRIGVLTGEFAERPIEELMTAAPQTAEMTTTIAYALCMMSKGGYRHIPIIDLDQTPVGIISVKDIVDYLADTVAKDLSAMGVDFTL